MAWIVLKLVLGVLLLNKAADWFARGAALIADLTQLPRLVMGAILVGFVTEIPEFAVSTAAAWTNHTAIALGNAIGSVTFNTGLILGLCLARTRIAVEQVWLRDHGVPMLLSCLVLCVAALWNEIRWPIALVLFLLCCFYVVWSVVCTKEQRALAQPVEEIIPVPPNQEKDLRHRWAVTALILVISIPLVFVSSGWVLSSAVDLARLLGISEIIIALTVVAAGTSLGELATALAASRRGHLDTSVGIVLGSNVFNTLGVVGLAGMIKPLPITAANRLYDLPVMMLVQIIPFLPCLIGRSPGRLTGYALLAVFGLYTYSLFTLYGVF